MIKSTILTYLLILALTSVSASYSSDYDNYLRFHWKGAIQSTSIQLKVFPYLDRLSGLHTFVVTYTKSNGSPVSPIITLVSFIQDPYPVQEVTLSGLLPDTQYFYTFIFTQDTVIVDPVSFIAYYKANSPQEFPFRTFKLALTPYSFTFGAASCADTGSSSPVFQNLIDENFDFFMHMGDLHYEDISVNDANRFFNAYYTVFASPSQKKFFQTVPVYYNWDDHDFGPNDADGNSLSKPAVTMVYQKFATYSVLKNRLPTDDSSIGAPSATAETPGMYLNYNTNSNGYGIFRSFIVGRCLFIILDLRTFNDVISGDILGDEQRSWIENQLRFAGNNPNIKMVFMISSVPWIDQDPNALWGDFGANQEWIGALVKQHIYSNGKEAMMIAGDAHMVALDDGRNNNRGGFPVVQAAALDRPASCKGGPYSHGTNPERGQYARIEVTDSGDSKPCVKVLLKRYGSNIIAYDTCYPELYSPSEDNHCPSKFMIWLKTYPGAIYIMAFGSLFVFGLICFTIFMCRRRRMRRKMEMQKKQKLDNEKKELEEAKTDAKHEVEEAKSMDFAPHEKQMMNNNQPEQS